MGELRQLLTQGLELDQERKIASGTSSGSARSDKQDGRPVIRFDNLAKLQEALRQMVRVSSGASSGQEFLKCFACLAKNAKRKGLSSMSNRRLVRILRVMAGNAAYEYANGMRKEPQLTWQELELVPKFFLDRFSIQGIQDLRQTCLDSAACRKLQ